MSIDHNNGNPPALDGGGTVAPITNVARVLQLLQQLKDRDDSLPGIGLFSGPSGFGKSTAAGFAAVKFRAYYLEVQSTWTRAYFLKMLLKSMGIEPAGTIPEMSAQASEQLALSGRPLIIDEFDYFVEKGKTFINLIRDLHNASSGSSILLIGEERLPSLLKKPDLERFDGRILHRALAAAMTRADLDHLNRLYVNKVEIAPDLLNSLHEQVNGSARYAVMNLINIQNFALSKGVSTINRKEWGDTPFEVGAAPRRTGR